MYNRVKPVHGAKDIQKQRHVVVAALFMCKLMQQSKAQSAFVVAEREGHQQHRLTEEGYAGGHGLIHYPKGKRLYTELLAAPVVKLVDLPGSTRHEVLKGFVIAQLYEYQPAEETYRAKQPYYEYDGIPVGAFCGIYVL